MNLAICKLTIKLIIIIISICKTSLLCVDEQGIISDCAEVEINGVGEITEDLVHELPESTNLDLQDSNAIEALQLLQNVKRMLFNQNNAINLALDKLEIRQSSLRESSEELDGIIRKVRLIEEKNRINNTENYLDWNVFNTSRIVSETNEASFVSEEMFSRLNNDIFNIEEREVISEALSHEINMSNFIEQSSTLTMVMSKIFTRIDAIENRKGELDSIETKLSEKALSAMREVGIAFLRNVLSTEIFSESSDAYRSNVGFSEIDITQRLRRMLQVCLADLNKSRIETGIIEKMQREAAAVAYEYRNFELQTEFMRPAIDTGIIQDQNVRSLEISGNDQISFGKDALIPTVPFLPNDDIISSEELANELEKNRRLLNSDDAGESPEQLEQYGNVGISFGKMI